MENKKLLEEISGVKKWMQFLDNKKNYNRSFRKEDSSLIKEDFRYEEDPNDQYGSPEEKSDELLLGDNEQTVNAVEGGSYLVLSTDINGKLYVNLVEGDSEEEVIQKSENEMLTQMMVVPESDLVDLITKLTQYLPEEITSEDEPTKPPFIDEPDTDVIDEDLI
jgi:hypothetical protein